MSDEYEAVFNMGVIYLDLSQPALTHTVQEAVDPLEWTELMGNIGGTWGRCHFVRENVF